jgi:hypothetical protein
MHSLRFALLTLVLGGLTFACGSGGGPADGGHAGAGGGAGGGAAGNSGGAGGAGRDGGAGRNGGAGKDGGADGGVPDTTWKENGVLRTATYASLATRYKTAASDTLNFVATDFPAGATLSFAVSEQSSLGGTYGCGADGGTVVAVSYDNVQTMDQSCSITVSFTTDAAGKAHATGTFEAVVTIPAGTKTLTEGQFDLVVMPL